MLVFRVRKGALATGGKRNLILVGSLALVALVLLAFTLLTPRRMAQGTESEVLITLNGTQYARIPLSQPQTLVVEQPDGKRNEVTITPQGAVMTSSSCDNQLCVEMGEVTLDNMETRPNQAFIICLPNRVTVELLPAAASGQ